MLLNDIDIPIPEEKKCSFMDCYKLESNCGQFVPLDPLYKCTYDDIINYAYKKRVWITSPTTLISTLTVIEMIIKNMERDKYAKVIHEELNKLGLEFARYKDRWDKLSRSIETVNKDIQNVSVTTDKITKKFETINKVDVNKLLEKKK